MKNNLLFLLLIIPVLFVLQGCYTVVMVDNPQPSYTSEDSFSYQDAEDTSVINEDQADVVNHYYIYGDLWPGYVPYDPFWASPYWVHYPSWNRWSLIYDPWGWDYGPYSYGFYYSYYPSHYWSRHYYDPYDAYWYGYYDGSYYGGVHGYQIEKKKQPFSDRASSGNGLMGVAAKQTNSSAGIAKRSDDQTHSSFYNRERVAVRSSMPSNTSTSTQSSGSRSVVNARPSGSQAGTAVTNTTSSSGGQRSSTRAPSVSSSSSQSKRSSSSVKASTPKTSSQPSRRTSSQSTSSGSSGGSSKSVVSGTRSSSGSSSGSSSRSSSGGTKSSGSSGRTRKR